MNSDPIKLGDEIEDVVAKVRGIAHGRVEYLDGTVYWIVQPGADDQGGAQKEVHCSDAYCKRVGDGVRIKPKPPTGFHIRDENDAEQS